MSIATPLVPRANSCTLYELEDNLQALVDSIDLAEEPSAREFILEEIGHALRKAADKREVVVDKFADLVTNPGKPAYEVFPRLRFTPKLFEVGIAYWTDQLHEAIPTGGTMTCAAGTSDSALWARRGAWLA